MAMKSDNAVPSPGRRVDGFVSRPAPPLVSHPIKEAELSVGKITGSQPLPDPTPIGPIRHTPWQRSAPIQRRRSLPTRKQVTKRIALGLVAIIAAVAIGAGGWVFWKFVHNLAKISHGNILGLLATTKLKGEDQGRVNILVAGDSADDPNHDGANLTDSIMIISIDPTNHTAFMLSIPRDLWVKIPGNGYSKINAANVYGDAQGFNESGYAPGGMGLLEKTIQQNLGITINYEALVNYTAFRDTVNAIGGIDVTIASSDSRGIYDPNISKVDKGPLILKNGLQHLDGQTALNLARARNDPTPAGLKGYGLPNGDFDRAANQRLMLLGIKSKIFSTGVLANPAKLGQLLDAVGNNLTTDFKTEELHRLYDIFKAIDNSKITSLSLQDPAHNVTLLANYATPDGQSALIPAAGVTDYSQIQLFIKKQTSNDPVLKEGATVEVLNGGGVSGLAKKNGDALTAKNVDVVGTDNAPHTYTTTSIIDNSKGTKPATKQLLQKLYGSNISTDATLSSNYDADFIIVLGTDQAVTTAH